MSAKIRIIPLVFPLIALLFLLVPVLRPATASFDTNKLYQEGYPAPSLTQIPLETTSFNATIYLPSISTPRFGPLPAPGYYVSELVLIGDTDRFYLMGCEKGRQDLNEPGTQKSVVYLDFGGAAYDPYEGYGAKLFQIHTFWGTGNLEESSFQFARGYYDCSVGDNSSRIVLALSINNGNDFGGFNWEHGVAWGQMIRTLYDRLKNSQTCQPNNGCNIGTKVTPVAGGDFEMDWNSYENTLSWILGYMVGVQDPVTHLWRGDFYNFGDAAGCPWTWEGVNYDWNYVCNNDWTQDDVIYISDKLPGIHANVLPEVYFPYSGLEIQWANLSRRAAAPSSYSARMSIDGVTSNVTACWQRRDSANPCPEYYSSDEAYKALYIALAQSTITTETTAEMSYITDMCWLEDQYENFCIIQE